MFTLTAKSSGFIYTLQLIIHVFIFSITCRNLRWYGTSVHISMWIKIHFNQYTFTVLEFSSSAIFDQTVWKIVGKVKFLKSPAGFDLKSYRVVVNALYRRCVVTLLLKTKIIKLYLKSLFISTGSKSQYGGVP